MTIPLIDKQDTFEVVGLQISSILASERDTQIALATGASKDPSLWDFDVYSERFSPWEAFLNDDSAKPFVNVSFDSSNFNMKDGDTVGRQAAQATYNLDVYNSTTASDDVSGGHNPGDESSSRDLHRIIRLVRNIIMHPDYTYLDLREDINGRSRAIVWQRWVQSIEVFQPNIGERPIQNVIASRINLQVKFNELSVNETFNPLESVYMTAKRAEDGKIVFETEFSTV